MEKSVQTFLKCLGFAVLCLLVGLHWDAEKACVGSSGLARATWTKRTIGADDKVRVTVWDEWGVPYRYYDYGDRWARACRVSRAENELRVEVDDPLGGTLRLRFDLASKRFFAGGS
jgi:hypothetical protein